MKAETGAGGERRKRVRGKGLESRLLAAVRWTAVTGVAFPQKSESILAHHLKRLTIEKLTEISDYTEISLSFLKRNSTMYLEN